MAAASSTLTLFALLAAGLLLPGASDAAVFQNPLQGVTIESIIRQAILWLLGLAGFIGLLALVVGGMLIVAGPFSEKASNVKLGRQIITWAVIGLLIVGMAATILAVTGQILGIRGGIGGSSGPPASGTLR
jgi:hypothetical protein